MKIQIKKESIAVVVLVIVFSLILLARYIIIEINDNEVSVEAGGNFLITEESKKIKVYICGEVANPGVYELTKGDRVDDLVALSGGFTEFADLNRINLAKILSDEGKITIYAFNNEEDGVKYIGVDVFNYGTKEVLLEIDGLGEVLVSRIITYRESNSFSAYEDLLNVEGIGDGKLKTIIEYVENN